MAFIGLLVGFATLGLDGPTPTASDSVTFRDGSTALGHVLDGDRRGPLMMLIRRSWALAKIPERAAAWEKAEAPLTKRAEAQRVSRLQSWKRERQPSPDNDRIGPWIDSELARLTAPGDRPKSPLMLVKLSRTDVKAMARRPANAGRMLRLGWLSNFPDVETMPSADLSESLEARGFAPTANTPVSVDSLLPLQPEDDAHWLMRRAATELADEPGGRFLRYQGMVLPEPAPGEALPAAAGLNAALGTLKELLGEAQVDPLPEKLRDLAGKGRVGSVVTRLELSEDLANATVETTLWVRVGDRWNPAVTKSSRVSLDDLPADAGDGLADDPQVKAVFGMVEGLGLGQVPPELKRRSLNMGAATRKALGEARSALDREMTAIALPLGPANDRPAPANPPAKP